VSFVRALGRAEAIARNAGPVLGGLRDLAAAGTQLHRSLRGSPASQYAATHGGIEPRIEDLADVPNSGVGLVVLGELDAVIYWADKGQGPQRFCHDFAELPEQRGRKVGALPLLAFASDGSGLVIARGLTSEPRDTWSRYAVTAHGIEG
jgi:hypothetical protein